MQTQAFIPQTGSARLVVLAENKVKVFDLKHKEDWLVGRTDPTGSSAPDIPVASSLASRKHGWLRRVNGQWYFLDNPANTNGTYHNGVKIPRAGNGKVMACPLKDGDVLRIDGNDLQHGRRDGVLMFFTMQMTGGEWKTFPLAGRNAVTIGRDKSCDIAIPLPYLSARHAQLTCQASTWYIRDCGSTAGTFHNGKALTGSAPLREKDCISLCDCSFFFLGQQLLYIHRDPAKEKIGLQQAAPQNRPVILHADIATKQVKNNSGSGMKELIRDVHLDIRQGTLVALLGTAGAGKSTIMNCLNGMDLEGVQGSVLYRGVDLMHNFDQMKYLIGSVPQKKTFHPSFTPEQEFRLAARKRLPGDVTDAEIEERVTRTLEMLSMTGVRKNRNSKLSGGEQTRVNVGIELVADRDLLCLDEPDQGLSPNYKHELFEILQNLAHKNGKSILTIIHDVSEIDMFDQVIIMVKADGVGRLAFSGTPEEARRYFGVEIQDVYALLEQNPSRFVR